MVQIESICRRQNKCDEKMKFGFGIVENVRKGIIENVVGKEENDVFFPLKVFQRLLLLGRNCVVKN